MPRIAEKLEFMNVRAVTVCAKARIGRKVRHKKRVFMQIFSKIASEKIFSTVQGDFGKIIVDVRRKLCFLSV